MRKGELRKESILKTAERLFFEKGYEETSIQDICINQKILHPHFCGHYIPLLPTKVQEQPKDITYLTILEIMVKLPLLPRKAFVFLKLFPKWLKTDLTPLILQLHSRWMVPLTIVL